MRRSCIARLSALGLDRDDLVVRRRLVQKMEMLALQDRPGVGESDLMDYYLAHRADYVLPESVSFRHVFFSAATRGDDARGTAAATLGQLRYGGASEATRLGDPPPMPPEASDWTRTMVEDRFGMDFAVSVFEVDQDAWCGPILSAYGHHLVFVSQRSAARVPDFAEVASRIATDLDATRRSDARDGIYASIRDDYQVEVEPTTASTPIQPLRHDQSERTRA